MFDDVELVMETTWLDWAGMSGRGNDFGYVLGFDLSGGQYQGWM